VHRRRDKRAARTRAFARQEIPGLDVLRVEFVGAVGEVGLLDDAVERTALEARPPLSLSLFRVSTIARGISRARRTRASETLSGGA